MEFYTKQAISYITYNIEDDFVDNPEGWYPKWTLVHETFATWKNEQEEFGLIKKIIYRLIKDEQI